MKFKLIEEWLFEDIESVKAKYPKIDDTTFFKLIRLDPTFKEDRDSLGTYGKWILNLYQKGNLNNIGHVKDLLTRFEENKKQLKNKDINSFKSMEEVDSYLNDDDNYNELSHRQEVRGRQKDRRNADVEKDYKTTLDGFDIYVPSSYANSCKLGQDASWCTASTESDYYYNYYKDNYGGEYYILINQENPEEKYQFHFESDQFMNKKNGQIDLKKFFSDKPELKQYFMPMVFNILDISDKDETVTATYEGSNAVEWFSNECNDNIYYGKSDKIYFNSAITILSGELPSNWDFYYSYSWDDSRTYLPSFDDSVKQELQRLHIDPNNFVKDVESEWAEESYDYDIKDAYTSAYSMAVESGSFDECYRDVKSEFNNLGINIEFLDEPIIDVKIPTEKVLDIYFSGDIDFERYWTNEKLDAIIISYVTENYSLYEPRYGWNGFNEEVFNEEFEYRLSEIDEVDRQENEI